MRVLYRERTLSYETVIVKTEKQGKETKNAENSIGEKVCLRLIWKQLGQGKLYDNIIKKINNKKYNCGGSPAFKSLTKNWITISILKISSIHKFILKMQQILGSHELTGHGHF